MALVDDRIFPRAIAPFRPPFETVGIDELAWAVHIVRLKARGRIRHQQSIDHLKPIPGAGTRSVDLSPMPAFGGPVHNNWRMPIDEQCHLRLQGRPNTEGCSVLTQLWSKLHTRPVPPRSLHHGRKPRRRAMFLIS